MTYLVYSAAALVSVGMILGITLDLGLAPAGLVLVESPLLASGATLCAMLVITGATYFYTVFGLIYFLLALAFMYHRHNSLR